MDSDSTRKLNGSGAPFSLRVESESIRQVVDSCVALRLELRRAVLELVERTHVVRRQHRPAARGERAIVGIEAVRPCRDAWKRPRERGQLRLNFGRDAGEA